MPTLTSLGWRSWRVRMRHLTWFNAVWVTTLLVSCYLTYWNNWSFVKNRLLGKILVFWFSFPEYEILVTRNTEGCISQMRYLLLNYWWSWGKFVCVALRKMVFNKLWLNFEYIVCAFVDQTFLICFHAVIWKRNDLCFPVSSLSLIQRFWKFWDKPVTHTPYRFGVQLCSFTNHGSNIERFSMNRRDRKTEIGITCTQTIIFVIRRH